MSKELEFIETITTTKELKPYLEQVKKELKRLESIDNSNPSEALEITNSYLKVFEEQKVDVLYDIESFKQDFITIKQALIKAQEDKIIADFIREHYKLSDDINENYLVLKKPIIEEEHIKFKENL